MTRHGSRRLVGVGVGPGDHDLVTLRAVRVLREACAVLVPVMAGSGTGAAPDAGAGAGRAEATVLAHVDAALVRRIPFALDDRGGVTPRRERAWDDAARTVVGLFDEGKETIAFATIGDPNLYSTFHYLAQTVRAVMPEVAISTVPGITAMQDLAARSGTVLAEGREPLTVIPMTAGREVLESALAGAGTVVIYKGGRHMADVREALAGHGRARGAVVGCSLGLGDERVTPLSGTDGPLPYLSTVLAPPERGARGEKL
jgi:precorrin-2/cobalt-factor-2 C20-methyltransferase